MNRVIKFRAWDNERKEMFKCSGIHTLYNQDSWGSPRYTGDNPADTILMQFTGLCDKNGIEIFEGDIVRYTQSERFGESTNEYTTTVKYEGCGFTPMKYAAEVEDDFYSCHISNIEVIGNVFQS